MGIKLPSFIRKALSSASTFVIAMLFAVIIANIGADISLSDTTTINGVISSDFTGETSNDKVTGTEVFTSDKHLEDSFTSASFSDSARLFNDVISPYDRRVRPVKNQSSPLAVHIMFHLLSIIEVDELNQNMDINAWMSFDWMDEIRPWDAGKYGGIKLIHPETKDIWLPRLFVTNSQGDKRDVFSDDASFLFIFSDGTSEWAPGTVIDLSCAFDLTYFPFDKQFCHVKFLSLDFDHEIHLAIESTDVNLINYEQNGEWDLISAKMSNYSWPYANRFVDFNKGVKMNGLTVTLELKRRPMFYMVNILAPVISLSAFSSLVFVLPADSGERASYSVTILLALSVFMTIIAGQLPNNSDTFPIIAHYLLALFAQSGLCVITSVCLLRWEKRSTDIDPNEGSSGELSTSGRSSSVTSTSSLESDKTVRKLEEDARNSYKSVDEKVNNHHMSEIPPDYSAHCRGACKHVGNIDYFGPFNGVPQQTESGVHDASFRKYLLPTHKRQINNQTGSCGIVQKILKDKDWQLFFIFNVFWVATNIFFVFKLMN